MKIIQEPVCCKFQKCHSCEAIVEIRKEDLYLSGKDLVYTCPVCHRRSGIDYTFDKTVENVGIVRVIEQLSKMKRRDKLVATLVGLSIAVFLFILIISITV